MGTSQSLTRESKYIEVPLKPLLTFHLSLTKSCSLWNSLLMGESFVRIHLHPLGSARSTGNREFPLYESTSSSFLAFHMIRRHLERLINSIAMHLIVHLSHMDHTAMSSPCRDLTSFEMEISTLVPWITSLTINPFVIPFPS